MVRGKHICEYNVTKMGKCHNIKIKMSNQRKTFNKLYDKYIEKIYRFVFFKVSSKEIAEDLTSEVFARFWKTLQKDTKLDNPSAFLYRIARNLITDFYRQKQEPQVSLADCKEIVDPDVNLAETASSMSDLEQVKVVLSSLSDDYREIVTLRYTEDYSISEIAKLLDRPEGTVRVMLHRGLEELKEKLKGA